MKRLIFITILYGCISLPLLGWAQKEFRTWCYGEGSNLQRSIRVNFDPRPGLPDSCKFQNYGGRIPYGGGTASISDAQGRLVCYSGGISVMDRAGGLMPHGVLLAPDSASSWFSGVAIQPVVLTPAPANPAIYYLFYWRQALKEGKRTYAITSALIDRTLNGGLGDVVRKGQVLGYTAIPGLTAIRHLNNRDYWVVIPASDGRGFQSFLVNSAAVSAPVHSSLDVPVLSGGSELKASPNGRRLAFATSTLTSVGQEYPLYVYDFDNATGLVSHATVVHRGTEGALSLSFSPNSQVLYATAYPAGRPLPPRRLHELWQYNLAAPTPAAVQASRFCVSRAAPTPSLAYDYVDCQGLQLAPDSTLWAAGFYMRNPFAPVTRAPRTTYAAVVRHPNVLGPDCGFEPEAYAYLPGQTTGATLPNLITNMLYAPAALNYEATCPDDSVQFWASSAGDPAGLRWDFGEPDSGAANAATGPFVAHRYARGSTYAVRLTLADGHVLTQPVTVRGTAAGFTQTNIFTPNGDGLNDWFVPVRQPLPGGRLRVFSRWGTLVFQTHDPALRWDGAGAAAGEYLYQLDYPDCQGSLRQLRGNVTLVR